MKTLTPMWIEPTKVELTDRECRLPLWVKDELLRLRRRINQLEGNAPTGYDDESQYSAVYTKHRLVIPEKGLHHVEIKLEHGILQFATGVRQDQVTVRLSNLGATMVVYPEVANVVRIGVSNYKGEL